jgi:hypothetical protein
MSFQGGGAVRGFHDDLHQCAVFRGLNLLLIILTPDKPHPSHRNIKPDGIAKLTASGTSSCRRPRSGRTYRAWWTKVSSR